MGEWAPLLSRLGKPRYLAIADAIAEDIRNGKLAPLGSIASATQARAPPQYRFHDGGARLCRGTKARPD